MSDEQEAAEFWQSERGCRVLEVVDAPSRFEELGKRLIVPAIHGYILRWLEERAHEVEYSSWRGASPFCRIELRWYGRQGAGDLTREELTDGDTAHECLAQAVEAVMKQKGGET